jgi:hypothetical protein
MTIFKKAIPRRAFLRGMGVTIGLPLLDGMVPAFASALDQSQAVRLSFIYGPNGRIPKSWTPATEGAGYEMTPTLAPLAPFRDQLLVLSGLDAKAADARPGEGGGNHARPCASFLTGIHPQPSQELGPSVDQLAAREFGKNTQVGSLELSMESADILGKGDGQYTDAFTKSISWRSGTQPLPAEDNPRKVFERLFGDTDSTDPAERLRQVRANRSVLDSVTDAVARLSGEIGAGDRVRLNEYLDSIRDIERRIQLAEQQATRELPTLEKPPGVPAAYSEHAKLLFDLQWLAFQGDLTRVTTFMWGMEQGEGDYREVGVQEGHHACSHHSGIPQLVENVQKIDAFHSSLFAYFLEKLRGTRDGEGTLLDHSLIVYGSGLSDGMAHSHNDVPRLVAGGAMGKIKGGRHIRYQGLPASNLLLSVLDIAGLPVEGFLVPGYSDGSEKLNLLSL